MNRFTFFKRYGLSVITAAIIFYLCVSKPTDLPQIETFAGFDKLVHIIMYLSFGLVLNFDFWRHSSWRGFTVRTSQSSADRKSTPTSFIWTVAFPIAYGGIIELLQACYFPPRTGEWTDWMANIIGVALAFFIFHKILKNRIKCLKKLGI